LSGSVGNLGNLERVSLCQGFDLQYNIANTAKAATHRSLAILAEEVQVSVINQIVSVAPTGRSAAAQRMRAHRKRRRAGLRCIVVQLRETEVDVLIRRGLLSADARNDVHAVRDALHAHFDRTLATAK
jgi:hypothetical protein